MKTSTSISVTNIGASKGVSEYILQRKIKRAKELIITTDLSISEISNELGLSGVVISSFDPILDFLFKDMIRDGRLTDGDYFTVTLCCHFDNLQ